MESIFKQLGLTVFERGWLSSNNILFAGTERCSAAVVDTGYPTQAAQTEQLIRAHFGREPLGRVLNTHLHSDHCGGNALLRDIWGCEVSVPAASFAAAASWHQADLSFEATGQTCSRFTVDRGLEIGERVRLGGFDWEVLAAPGHDPEAVLYFEPRSKVLISGDALWENRLAIVFPELVGESGFDGVERALSTIEALNPAVVIPGHGRAFSQVSEALALSRRRLRDFESDPARHTRYATRALIMFHMLEMRQLDRDTLIHWVLDTPIFIKLTSTRDGLFSGRANIAEMAVAGMLRDGLLEKMGNLLSVPQPTAI